MTTLKLLAELETSNKRIDEIINAIIAERDTLKQQNAELAAQVEVLQAFAAEMKEFLSMMHSEPTEWTIKESMRLHKATPAQCLLEVKADAVLEAVKYCNHYMAFPVSRGNIADAVLAVDELTTYANKIRGGE